MSLILRSILRSLYIARQICAAHLIIESAIYRLLRQGKSLPVPLIGRATIIRFSISLFEPKNRDFSADLGGITGLQRKNAQYTQLSGKKKENK